MSNERYTSFLVASEGDRTAAYYQAPSAAGFNPVPNKFLWAGVLFALGGRYLDAVFANPPSDVFLWGNEDTAGFKGWSIRIRRDTTGVRLVARYGNGATFTEATYLLGTLIPAVGTPTIARTGVAERLILAMIGINTAGTDLVLGINGQIVSGITGQPPYVASTQKCTLGAAPDGSLPALNTGVRISSAGFINTAAAPPSLAGGNKYTGTAFYLARETREIGFFVNQAGEQLDWDHKYLSSSAAFAGTPPVGGSGGLFVSDTVGPASLPDVGNEAVVPAAGISPIALAATGSVKVMQEANVDWYAGGEAAALLVEVIG